MLHVDGLILNINSVWFLMCNWHPVVSQRMGQYFVSLFECLPGVALLLFPLFSLASTVILKLPQKQGGAILRSATLQATNRGGVKGQSCNTQTIDGANIPWPWDEQRGEGGAACRGKRKELRAGRQVYLVAKFSIIMVFTVTATKDNNNYVVILSIYFHFFTLPIISDSV